MFPPGLVARVETPTTAEAALESVCVLFAEVFGSPPLNRSSDVLTSQRRALASLVREPGFGMATTWRGGDLAGFAYGTSLAEKSSWWDRLQTAVPDEVVREWAGRTFVIIDMAVGRSWQGRGVGRWVLETLLASRTEERASLSVVPDNERAHGFYRHLGWEYVGRVRGAPHHTAPYFDKYVLGLR